MDSRKKLEADAGELVADYARSGSVCDELYNGILGLLDRQAALTERETKPRDGMDTDWKTEAACEDTPDSREKLESEMHNILHCISITAKGKLENGTFEFGFVDGYEPLLHDLLDRQASITEREVEYDLMKAGRMAVEVERERIAELQAKVDELTEERDEAVEAYDAHMAAHDAWHEAEDIEYTRNRFAIYEQAAKERIARLESERDEWKAKAEGQESLAGRASSDYLRKLDECDELSTDNDHLQRQMLGLEDDIISLETERDELQAKLDAYDETHMALPLDADGVPIHIGDMLECHANGYDGKFEVFAVGAGVAIGNHDIEFVTRHPTDWFHVSRYCRHVKPRTVEDVLATFRFDAKNIYDDPTLNGNERVDELVALDERVAAEIRELMGVDE